MDLRKIKSDPEDFGLMTYDPAFMNTASCKSAISYIDGDKGILRYLDIPLKFWPSAARSWKSPTCFCSATCPCQAMGFRPEMFTMLFAIPRTAGWLAHWQELITDPEQKIAPPRQVYTGHGEREFLPTGKRLPAPIPADSPAH